MATTRAARVLGMQGRLGQLTPGAEADVVLLDGAAIFAPGLAAPGQVFDRLVHYGAPDLVRDVFVGGEHVVADGLHQGPQTLDEDSLRAALAGQVTAPDEGLVRFLSLTQPYLRRILTGAAQAAASSRAQM